jgi:hypothetical protein
MATFHMQINTGGKGEAAEHGLYIGREGRFTEEKYGEVQARGVGNLPEWARGDTQAFWKASDEFERSNGNTYREYELALPRELSHEQRVALVERYVAQELGTARPYQWAIHHAIASDGKEQPHVHIMFSDRQQDGIERGPEQFFKRYNSKHPERGGCQKATYGDNKAEAAVVYEKIRERWANVQNQALEMAGVEARVDHRSLAAQGIRNREPQRHRGPAVSGIEARGEVSHVGRRQREQREYRIQKRAAVVADVRVVTREEMALERVAVRERRELAREVTGEDRALVMPLVEADRREQLGRAQAAAERRVERRQGLGIGELQEKLVAQARALRARLGREIGRVKEWVAERFPAPLKQIKERTRDLIDTVVEKTQRALGRDAGPERGDGTTRTAQGGLFDDLKLGTGPAAGISAPQQSVPAAPAETASMSLAEQLELRSNAVAERLDREARATRGTGIEDDAWRRQRGLEAPDRLDGQEGRGGRHAAGHETDERDGEVGQRRSPTLDGANELTLEQQLHARADEVARRVEQETVQDGAQRAQRADLERQRVLDEPEDQSRGRGRSRGRHLGDDDEFTRGPSGGLSLGDDDEFTPRRGR